MKLVPGATRPRVSHDAPTPRADPSRGHRSRPRRGRFARPSRLVAAASVLVLPIALVLPAATAQAKAQVGQGFTVTPSDLAFILKQIKIAERHSRAIAGTEPTAAPNPDPTTDPNYCAALIGPGRDQIPDKLAPYGLRTVDGSCNNLIPGRETFGAADQTMPRHAAPVFRDAETSPAAFGPPVATSYQQKKGSVFDSRPRMISNLISDQTSTNPAAVAAAGFPVRTQGNPGLFPCTTEPGPDGTGGVPAGCVPKYQTLFIPNVSTDVGLTPPYNSLFTFFGQFFDHGLDQAVKGGGTVFVPLQADDPLIPGADHVLGTADDLPADQRFMVLTRAQNQPGPDGILGDRTPTTPPTTACTALNTPAGCDESADDVQEATNTDSPWIDQSQTYSSHPAHQVFLRQYVNNVAGRPVSTGALLPGSGARDTGLATWADLKAQAATLLGLRLTDADALSVPMIATDPYGKFLPGPLRGLPQYVTSAGLVEGNAAAPVAVPANARTFSTPFLTDITDNAVPRPGYTPDADSVVSPALVPCAQPGVPAGCVNEYDDEMLDLHFVAGDGRANENIALSSIHQVFHSEHDRLVTDIQDVLTNDTTPSGVAALTQWQDVNGAGGWNGERLFQAARFVTEMEYQHLVFGEFARKMAPAIPVFRTYDVDINAAVRAEFAHAVYRLGHSMLDEQVVRTRNGKDNSLPLLKAFLNPPEYFNGGPVDGELSPEQAAGSILMGASDQVGNELDEFMTDTLRNNLLGLPLDLATLNLTRARETGVPPLNGFRRQLFAATNDSHLRPYKSWTNFGQGIKHPESLVNFVAAYGTHPTILTDVGPDGVLVDDPGTPADESADNGPATLASRRLAAKRIVDPAVGEQHAPTDAADFMFGTNAWAVTSGATTTGVDDIDLWVGGLAEATEINGGLLGSTFDAVFERQMTDLQDGDRLYYLARTPGMNLGTQLEGNSFAEMILRNTVGTDTLSADAFGTSDCKFQLKDLDGTAAGFDALGATIADDPLTTACDESKLLQRMPDGTIQYRQNNSVDPPGINKQAVYNGTTNPDRVWGGNGNDTFWGLTGNDVIEGGAGIDNVLGGEGNDVITDTSGADILKGGPGNDAVDGGPDNDILLGGDGQDVLNGGANDNQDFGGPGDDFIIGGLGADAVQGDGGDDWLEGGPGQDLLTGDHGSPFFDDPGQVTPGNEVMIGQTGDDYVAEGGDDLMAANAAPIDTFIGSAGFDWAFHQFDTVAANDDLTVAPGVQLPPG